MPVGPLLCPTKPLRLRRGRIAGVLVVMVLAVAILATPPTPVSTPTAAGLSGADLIGILGIVAVFFGLVLTALGALMLRTLGNMDKRVSELKVDFTRDFGYVWNAIDGIYRRLWNERVPTQGDYRDQQL